MSKMMTWSQIHIGSEKYPIQVSDSDTCQGIHGYNDNHSSEQSCYHNTSTTFNQMQQNSQNDTSASSKYDEMAKLQGLADEQHERKRKLLFTQTIDKHSSFRPSPVCEPTHRRQSTKFRSYKTDDIRIKSFIGFTSVCNRSPQTFAASGFFYKGFADMVACFQCGFTHKNWQVNDDPFLVHKTFQPDCDFITELCRNGVTSSADLGDDNDKDVEMKVSYLEKKIE